MTLEEFKQSISQNTPPEGMSNPLKALWYAHKEDWNQAHEWAQKEKDSESAWVHAYLHRQEGDILNAEYWYTRASRTLPDQTLHEEWEEIAQNLLS